MIDAKDLRIGNTLHDTFFEVQKVAAINKNRVRFENGETSDYKSISPITLTIELLKNCKFEYDCSGSNFIHPKIGYAVKFRHMTNWVLIKVTGGTQITSIKYIHQLQNFYHSITGEELQFNHQNLNLCLS